jgi:uncharacterized membrane protein YgcG
MSGGIFPPQKRPSQLRVEDVTPEVAAHVVRNYLLPMFESDIKKGLRKGINKSGASPNKDAPDAPDNSVYGELKLSEKL